MGKVYYPGSLECLELIMGLTDWLSHYIRILFPDQIGPHRTHAREMGNNSRHLILMPRFLLRVFPGSQ